MEIVEGVFRYHCVNNKVITKKKNMLKIKYYVIICYQTRNF